MPAPQKWASDPTARRLKQQAKGFENWSIERGKYGYHARHEGIAMNQKQWQKPGIWIVDTIERTGECSVSFTHPTDSQQNRRVFITVVGDTLTVGKGPFHPARKHGTSPLLAGIHFVQQQENAAIHLGSK